MGVLARLAELGILRQVEVISSVSGGSIISAVYYLRARYLLQGRDLELSSESDIDGAFVEQLHWVAKHLRGAIRKNPRARILLNPLKNLRIAIPGFRVKIGSRSIVVAHYSRTDRIGDLLDRYLYKEAWGAPLGKRGPLKLLDKQIRMSELKIQPLGAPSRFDPKTGNAGRKAKVPILLLNATSLNTGHNWRFEAIGMGEQLPATAEVVSDVQKNSLLAEGYFEGDPIAKRYRDFPLGLAVAASAAVPGVFHPLAITGLYPGWRVQLVDGGVHDNQGVQGLLDKACTHLIISDAAAQMPDSAKPPTRIPSVLSRSIGVYGSRLREEELVGVEERARSKSVVRAVALLHLRKGLGRKTIAPLDDQGGAVPAPAAELSKTAAFGVDEDVQSKLAGVRTDLDAFSDVEFESLMFDGYTMADLLLAGCDGFRDFRSASPVPESAAAWGLKRIEDLVAPAASRPGWYDRSLDAASRRFFRFLSIIVPARLLKTAKWVPIVAVAVLLVLGGTLWRTEVLDGLRTHWPIWWLVLGLGAPLIVLLLYVQTSSSPVVNAASTTVISLLAVVVAVPAVLVSIVMWAETPLLLWLGRVRADAGRAADHR